MLCDAIYLPDSVFRIVSDFRAGKRTDGGGLRRTRYTVPAALTTDLVGFLAAAWCVRLFF